jgi:hypothetical protein
MKRVLSPLTTDFNGKMDLIGMDYNTEGGSTLTVLKNKPPSKMQVLG